MDLKDIPGVQELWELTKGDARLKVGVLDGRPDLSHACFQGAQVELLDTDWYPGDSPHWAAEHATHVASMIFGQHGSPLAGLAPACRGLLIPCIGGDEDAVSLFSLVRGVNAAVANGCSVIHMAQCLPTVSGSPDPLLADALRAARQQGILLVAPAGNNEGDCYCFPSVLPDVLAVGAMGDNGNPRLFSNHGRLIDAHGVMAPGQNMLGARPGGSEEVEQGTSVSAPVVTGICCLLLSLLLREGRRPDAELIRQLVLETASPCPPEFEKRCLRGVLNLPLILERLLGPKRPSRPVSDPPAPTPLTEQVVASEVPMPAPVPPEEKPAPLPAARFRPSLVFALGRLQVEFPDESAEQEFSRRMGCNARDLPALLDYLEKQPEQLQELIWLLTDGERPLYAILPTGRYRAEIYQHLWELLSGQQSPEQPLERISLPGVLTAEQVELQSGQLVSVVQVALVRGIYGWSTDSMLDAVDPSGQNVKLRRAMRDFLEKVYGELHNAGLKSRERALNFSATNIFQAAWTASEAVNQGFELHSIEVGKSPFCRIFSDCWEVLLKFQDPEDCHRAYRVYRFSIDVSDVLPVTLGSIHGWASRV